jgi:hypothetical protein
MIETKSLEKAQERLVENFYYWDMYHSDLCWKGKQRIGQKMLAGLKSESAKLKALNKNIRMRVVGLGWMQFAITWSHCTDLGRHVRMDIPLCALNYVGIALPGLKFRLTISLIVASVKKGVLLMSIPVHLLHVFTPTRRL